MSIDVAMLVAGLALLVAGGDWVIKGALALGARMGVSPLLAGVVIVGFGTSSPELVVSLQAALGGNPDISIGNVVGSNIANILLILGVGCLIATMPASKLAIKRDGFTMLGASLLFIALSWDGVLSVWDGALFVAGVMAYVIWAYNTERVEDLVPETEAATAFSWWKTLGLLAVGFIALITGAQFFLSGAVSIAERLGIPEVIIGLTLVAVGTSLPELAATAIAAIRRQTDVAIGNIIGSNIFNILFILGVSSMITDLPVEPRIQAIDQWVMLGAAALLVLFMLWGRSISRWKGAVLLACYIAYIAAMTQS